MDTSAPPDGDFASYLEGKRNPLDGTRRHEEADVASNVVDEPLSAVDSATLMCPQ